MGAPSETRLATDSVEVAVFSPREVAALEGLTESAVRYEIRKGHLVAERSGHEWRVSPQACEIWRGARRARQASRRLKAWNALQERLLAHMAASGLSLNAVALKIGCGYQTLYAWFAHRDRTLSQAYIDGLADLFGISSAVAKAEAGGLSAEERKRAAAIKNLENVPQPGTERFAEARRKGTETLRETWRHREWSPDERARIAEGNRRAGSGERGRAMLKSYHESSRSRLLSPLWQFMRHHGKQPRKVVNEWAKVIAGRLDMSTNDVLLAWRPYLEKAGMWSARGAPRKDAARATLRELLHAEVAKLAEEIGLNELEARVGFAFWLIGGFVDVPSATDCHDDGYHPKHRAQVIRRVDWLIGDDCRKSLQNATRKIAA